MRVILLATDEAPKLSPLTDEIPGPLVPVANRPVIGIMLELLARAGCKKALVSLYERGGSISSYLNNGQRWGMQIDYLTQREALGGAGSLRWASHLLKETFLVLPADSILDLDLEAALAFHRAHGGAATAITKGQASGDVVRVDSQQVVELGASGTGEHVLTGAYLFEPSVLAYIPSGVPTFGIGELLAALLQAEQPIHAFETPGYWNPLTTFAQYSEAQRVFLMNAYLVNDKEQLASLDIPLIRNPSVEGRQIAPGIWVGLNDVIHPTAQIAPPVCIGDNCWIGRDTEIGPCVSIGANVVIDDEATVEYASVLERTYVGRLLKLNKVIAHYSTLIDTHSSHSTKVGDSFLLSEIGAEARGGFLRRLGNLFGATALLVLTAPLMAGIAVLAFLVHGRAVTSTRTVGSLPPTFRTRQGTGPYTFERLHFTTARGNGKTTWFGQFLKNAGLETLPGLINVIRAECELVGVKPLQPEEAARIKESWQQKHYDRPAGLTGSWYVQGSASPDLDETLVADAYYVSVRSWHGDILLLWKTFTTWLRRRFRSGQRDRKQNLAPDVRS